MRIAIKCEWRINLMLNEKVRYSVLWYDNSRLSEK